ncbi:hypothetical protein BGX20_009824 [Mortierella sp. AD010]|nr:hypothetical protein BGX20_009824 [Mortierella sp. AD010]
MHSLPEGEINSAEGAVSDRIEENIDHDTFIERLEDLDMTDMTVSPVATPLPTRNASLPSFRHAQTPLSSTAPTRRRRLIVEEESDQSVTDETTKDPLNNTDAATYLNAKQTPQGEVIQRTDYSPRGDDQDSILDSNKKNRVLKDITMLTPSRKSEKFLGQMTQMQQQSQEQSQQSQGQLQRSQEQPQQQGLQYQIRGQQGQQNTQQSITQRDGSSSTNTTQDLGTRRSLQPRGPWQAQRTEAMSQASSISSMADISSSVSSVVSPLAGAGIPNPSPNLVSVVESVVMAPQANLTNVFAMTQSTQFYVAEPSAYLPLLVHVPRYLRSRRKKSRQGRSVIRRMTPIVLSTNCNDQAKLVNGETPTPDITSPENSYLSHNVSMSADSQSTGGDA